MALDTSTAASLDGASTNGQSMTIQTNSVAEAQAFLSKHQVKYVLAQFVDIHGVAKTKSVPAAHLADIVEGGAGFAGFAVWGLGMQPHEADYLAVGDLTTLSLVPWQPGYARIACTGHVLGKPYKYDSRFILLEQIKRLTAQQQILNVGMEPEFMLFKRGADGSLLIADDSDTLEKPCYDYKGLSRSRAYLEKLTESLLAVGFDIYQIDHEDANGQFEINYTYSDALNAADRLVFFRMAASEIAREFGSVCSFMPKPLTNRTGSGLHMHLSLASEGKNVFVDKSDARGMNLSPAAYHFLGGLLAHAPALTALCAPSVNSYKRLVVGRCLSGATWAPAFISYGDNNRTTMVRVAPGRLELRLADPSCNPYLAIAAVIIAGLDGIERGLEPGEPRNFNHYDLDPSQLAEQGVRVLPQSLKEALDALEEDPLFAKQMGTDFMAEFLRLKRMEWMEYQRHVSDWEIKQYLEFF
jgi:glutamine synthetase